MPTLVRHLEIIEDDWVRVDGDEESSVERAILPFGRWQNEPGTGVWLDNDVEVESIGSEIAAAPLVAVHFPLFADGRGLSIGAMLRKHFSFAGELRAFGEILPDLAVFMHRCGFDSYEFANQQDAETAIECIKATTHHYQSSVREPTPPFRRAAW